MDRPIPKYLDYVIGMDELASLRTERRERDFALLRAIRLQSFGPPRPLYLHAECIQMAVHAHVDVLSSKVSAESRRAERMPIPCSPTPNCRGHPCRFVSLRWRCAISWDRDPFNRQVGRFVTEVRIGRQGVAFDGLVIRPERDAQTRVYGVIAKPVASPCLRLGKSLVSDPLSHGPSDKCLMSVHARSAYLSKT